MKIKRNLNTIEIILKTIICIQKFGPRYVFSIYFIFYDYMQYPNSYCSICNRGFSVLNQNKIFICHITEMYCLLGQKINPGVRRCQMKNK